MVTVQKMAIIFTASGDCGKSTAVCWSLKRVDSTQGEGLEARRTLIKVVHNITAPTLLVLLTHRDKQPATTCQSVINVHLVN